MITITDEYGKHRIKFSAPGTGWRSYSVLASDRKELDEALDHYFGGSKRAMLHVNNKRQKCPLCHYSRQEQKKTSKKK